MTVPRSQQISVEATPYYHCVSRCVRRAFLCGNDKLTGKSFEHRRKWIENKLLYISQYFMIDIASYAIMSNHYHVVLKIDDRGAKDLTDLEVVQHWHHLFKGSPLTKSFENNEKIEEHDKDYLKATIKSWRSRLCSISWFMRSINEPLARFANKEDDCTGRFWEGRFKSQALLDNNALLACMAYVDLNPVRAGISKEPTKSEFTSIKKRESFKSLHGNHRAKQALMPFSSKTKFKTNEPNTIPCSFPEYLSLLKWTAENCHKIKSSKKKQVPRTGSVQFNSEDLNLIMTEFEKLFKSLVGKECSYRKLYKNFKFKKAWGTKYCRKYFDT